MTSCPQLLSSMLAYSVCAIVWWISMISSIFLLMSLWHNVLGTVLLTTIIHQSSESSCLGSNGPKSMARNRTQDLSDLGAFHGELQRGYLLLSSATIRTFSCLTRGAAQWCHAHSWCKWCHASVQWSIWKMVRNIQFGVVVHFHSASLAKFLPKHPEEAIVYKEH